MRRASRIDAEALYRAYNEGRDGRTIADVAAARGINPNTARKAIAQYRRENGLGTGRRGRRPAAGTLRPRGPRQGFEERDGGAVVWADGDRVRTLEQLLAAGQVDRAKWRVKHYTQNSWESASKAPDGEIAVTTLYQVKAYLEPNPVTPVRDALADLIAQLRTVAPRLPAPRAHLTTGEYLLVPNLYDAHFGKRSADGHYTVARAASDFMAVTDAIVRRVEALGMPVERVMFPAGNDALHVDTLAGTTTKGTPVETSADPRTAIQAVLRAYLYAIRRLREIAPVDVVVVESNHDRMGVAWLGAALDALFSDADGVTVDAVQHPRKYYQYGATLLGCEHGDGTKPRDLAPLMAQEAPHQWAATRYRVWLRGHIHHSAGMYYPITSDGGVTTRVIPALCPADAYHILHGYVGSHRAAEVMYYHRACGPAGEFPVFVDEVVRAEAAAPTPIR